MTSWPAFQPMKPSFLNVRRALEDYSKMDTTVNSQEWTTKPQEWVVTLQEWEEKKSKEWAVSSQEWTSDQPSMNSSRMPNNKAEWLQNETLDALLAPRSPLTTTNISTWLHSWRPYSPKTSCSLWLVTAQMTATKGLKVFGEAGADAIKKELEQLIYHRVMHGVDPHKLTIAQKKAALQYLMFLKKEK
eukprot:scaffold2267_cov92-Cylindrotheca_fusiformis.AAC.7